MPVAFLSSFLALFLELTGPPSRIRKKCFLAFAILLLVWQTVAYVMGLVFYTRPTKSISGAGYKGGFGPEMDIVLFTTDGLAVVKVCGLQFEAGMPIKLVGRQVRLRHMGAFAMLSRGRKFYVAYGFEAFDFDWA